MNKDEVIFEIIPESYVGNYPAIVVHIKKSMLNPHNESRLREIFSKAYDEYMNDGGIL
jgi:hypothetical protein